MTLEEVIVAGQPAFIQMTGGLDFVLLDKLAIDMIDLKPKDTHSYICEPYDFESEEELRQYLELASKKSNFDQIFRQEIHGRRGSILHFQQQTLSTHPFKISLGLPIM
jgi:hypothetical protein